MAEAARWNAHKQLARLTEMREPRFVDCMRRVNEVARRAGLTEYTTYSRIWEYPWLWQHLEPFSTERPRTLDIGSERSALIWFMALRGFRSIVSDISAEHWDDWKLASRRLGVRTMRRLLDAQNLALATGTLDIYMSVSVLEHVANKSLALREAARVLRPGGILALTFDVCEPERGMTFPAWNGAAVTMAEFDRLVHENPWFEPGVADQPWNTEDISSYLAWHRTTAPRHNYVTAGALLIRTDEVWREALLCDLGRAFRGRAGTLGKVGAHEAKQISDTARRLLLAVRRRPLTWTIGQLTSPRAAQVVGGPVFRWVGRRRRNEEGLSQCGHILVVRLDEIGDAVMMSPFLRELRRNAPNARITMVVKPELVNLLERCPHINEVVAFDPRSRGLCAPLELRRRAIMLAWKKLWRDRFEMAILPRSDADFSHAAFLAYFSGAPRRVGYASKGWSVTPPERVDYDALLTDALDCPRELHEVERNLQLLRVLGGAVESTALELWLDAEDEKFASDRLSDASRPFVAFGPGGGQERKQWPAARFIALSRLLARESDVRFVVLGDKKDCSVGAALSSELGERVIDLTGRTTLRQAAAALRRCDLYVGNDTGPMHLAAAVGCPVVVISCHPRTGGAWSLNSPRRFGPWGVKAVVLQPQEARSPCRDTCMAFEPHCINGITVEQVASAIGEIRSRRRLKRIADAPS